MPFFKLHALVIVVTITLFAGTAMAQSAAPAPKQKPTSKTNPPVSLPPPELPPALDKEPPAGGTEAPEEKPGERDPFSVTDAIRRQAVQGVPAPGSLRVPSMRLVGYADDGVRPPLALVRMNGSSVLLIRANDVLDLPAGATIAAAEVKEITPTSVVLEVTATGQIVIVR